MRILLTGGAGDLSTVLTPLLEQRGDTALRLDIRPPTATGGVYLPGSILNRACLAKAFMEVDCIVHIAAWHGVHDAEGLKDVYAFWDLNVTGTFNVFEAAARAGIQQVVYMSSSSARHRHSIYGHTKVLGEEIAHTYAVRHAMNVVTLRPRGFIPHWNRATYTSFVAWAQWFWRGAVHIDDVAQAVLQSLDLLSSTTLDHNLVLPVDGAYDYTDQDLEQWDANGPGTTFNKYYPTYYDLAVQHGLNPAAKPTRLDLSETRKWLDYQPAYSLKNLLEELAHYGIEGPPPPFS
jgi:UDP-glucose 4-epimerase